MQLNKPEWLHAARKSGVGRNNATTGGGLIRGLVETPPDCSNPLSRAWVARSTVEHIIKDGMHHSFREPPKPRAVFGHTEVVPREQDVAGRGRSVP
eukprot:10803221-Lingulodinium_polyedra.AAC.1